MLNVKVFNQEGAEVKDLELNEAVFGIEPAYSAGSSAKSPFAIHLSAPLKAAAGAFLPVPPGRCCRCAYKTAPAVTET